MDAIILAAGSGTRMKAGKNKCLLKLLGRELLSYTIEAFEEADSIDNIIIVTGECDIEECKRVSKGFKKVSSVIVGGAARQESSLIGISASSSEYVLIHDGARALITADEINKVAEKLSDFDGVAIGSRCVDTLKRCEEDGKILKTVDRENCFAVFTPQAFKRELLLDCHIRAKKENASVTDDCALFEYFGLPVYIIEGSRFNIKLTVPEDMLLAEAILNLRK